MICQPAWWICSTRWRANELNGYDSATKFIHSFGGKRRWETLNDTSYISANFLNYFPAYLYYCRFVCTLRHRKLFSRLNSSRLISGDFSATTTSPWWKKCPTRIGKYFTLMFAKSNGKSISTFTFWALGGLFSKTIFPLCRSLEETLAGTIQQIIIFN